MFPTATPTSPTTCVWPAPASFGTTAASSSASWARARYPLPHLVPTMRKTARTAQYVQTLGPFFVGHVLWRAPSS